MDKYIQTLADSLLETSKTVVQMKQILFVLIKTEAVDFSKLTDSQKAMIFKFTDEWSEEWKKVMGGGK